MRTVELLASLPRLCDEDCNHCPLLHTPNTRHLAAILNAAYAIFGDTFYAIVEAMCPNLTVCPDCRIDDFCHIEGESCVLDTAKAMQAIHEAEGGAADGSGEQGKAESI